MIGPSLQNGIVCRDSLRKYSDVSVQADAEFSSHEPNQTDSVRPQTGVFSKTYLWIY